MNVSTTEMKRSSENFEYHDTPQTAFVRFTQRHKDRFAAKGQTRTRNLR
jgi:hypothetical protein